MKRNTCLVCGNRLFNTPILSLKNLPASAQGMPTFEQLGDDKSFDLELCQCSGCGLIQINGGPVDYYRDVIRSCNYNETIRRYRLEQYSHFIKEFSLQGKEIIEVGCGQGEFLDLFNNFDVKAAGLEHNEELVKIARGNGLEVFCGFATDEDTKIEGAPYDAFVSFNFLEHLPNPNRYLRCIYSNLSEEGCGLIAVPSFEYIVEAGRWYELIRDHLVYHTEESLRLCLEYNGFRVINCHRDNEDSILAIVQKKMKANAFPLICSYDKLKSQIKSFIHKYKSEGGRVAVWGASHQSFTLLSTMDMASDIEYIVDSAPFKQNRYSPASHIRIVSPEYLYTHPVEAIIIIAPAYTEEILCIIKKNYSVRVAAIRKNELTTLY